MMREKLQAKGNVQGIGYRAYVKSLAQRIGLKGFVRNEPDGSVLIVAEGAPEALALFREGLVIRSKDVLAPDVSELAVLERLDMGKPGYSTFEIEYGWSPSRAEQEMLERTEAGILVLSQLVRGVDDFRLESGSNFKELYARIDAFRKETGEKTDAFRKETSDNFNRMESRYGSISGTLDRIEKDNSSISSTLSRIEKKMPGA
jgi:acylphosphatase